MQIVAWQPPISPSDANRLSRIIRDSGGIVSAIPELRGADWTLIAREHTVHNVNFLVTIDSNFMISLLNLFQHRKSVSQTDRRAAALMALATMFNMQVNPTVAAHEYAKTAEGDPRSVLAEFRHADDLHPQAYADVALGRVTCLQAASQAEMKYWLKKESPVPPVTVKGYNLHYTAILGMLTIHTDPTMGPRTVQGQKKRMLRFLEWMHADFIFVGYATILASFLWGNGRVSSLLHNPNTKDPQKLLANAKNTVWDLSFAHTWAKGEIERAGRPGVPVNLLFTMDQGLALIADRLIQNGNLPDAARKDQFLHQLTEFWPERDAAEIADIEQEYGSRCQEPSRKCNRSSWQKYANGLTAKLEEKIHHNLFCGSPS